MISRLLNIGICVLGLMALMGGGWIAYREAMPYFFEGATGTERVVAALQFSGPPPISMPARRTVLLDCTDALAARNSLAMRYQGEAVRTQVIDHCQSLADDLTQRAPTDAFAWYVGASAAGSRDDWDGMNQRLLKSQQMGTNELWIAQFRAMLAEDNFSHLDADVAAGQDRDLKLLVTSGLGIRAVARRYVSDADFRERITQIVETLPELDQRRFATNVRLQALSPGASPN